VLPSPRRWRKQKLMTIDLDALLLPLRAEIESALATVGLKHGLTIKLGSRSDDFQLTTDDTESTTHRPIRTPTLGTEVCKRIHALRRAMDLSQVAFAAEMGVGRIAALYWESGRSKPSPEAYVRMANVAKELDISTATWFLEQAGIDIEGLRDLLQKIDEHSTHVGNPAQQR
jgi:transcriptional regulator with XRE-family HTH domain